MTPLGLSVTCYIDGGKAPPVTYTIEGGGDDQERSTTPSPSRVQARKRTEGFRRGPKHLTLNTWT
jgi:hypothetical protein